MAAPISVTSTNAAVPAVTAKNDNGDGVNSTGRRGVVGISPTFQGVYGQSTANAGVVGESTNLHGVYGTCHNPHGAGCFGTNDVGGMGIQGVSDNGPGVVGHSVNYYGVAGDSTGFAGVRGTSATATGTEGWSTSGAGIAGMSSTGVGVYGKGGSLAAQFDGPILVNGDIRLSNADCAEEFDILDFDTVCPGMVMVLSESGALRACARAYDKRAAGVLSGAGSYRPALVLDRQERSHRLAVGLVGKVHCRVDARYGRIEVGDLLTTSDTYGHAMKVLNPLKGFGAVIGKALGALSSGQALIPILIAMQ